MLMPSVLKKIVPRLTLGHYLHKHKIKHDKTTKQTSRFYLYDSDTIVIHIRTYLYMFARLYQYKYKSIL